ncbi:MAG: threonine ammonia-lyase [Gemmatimonadetes bacterium]|nr:threonine ammonia-lyase [Gemmatimonadota bacterium]
MEATRALTVDDVRAARERLADALVLTPCTESLVFGDLIQGRLHVKFENLQRTGSFKERGSLNKMLQLDARQRARGVVTASAGNHAQAVAYHAHRLGIAATVVMPENTPLIKVSNTEKYQAKVVLRGSIFDDAAVEAQRIEAEQGLVMIHPFDDIEVMAGQGTIGLEILEQVPDVDLVIVPVGGGGLISGIAVAIKSIRPDVRVIGVESAAAPSARASRDAGRIVRIEHADTIADGIATKQVGVRTFEHIQKWVDDLVVVTEAEIATAILLLLEREKAVAEGAGAAPAAALMSGRIPLAADQTTVFVLSGGNIDINRISRIIDRGLVADGRLIRLRVRMQDRPGSLARLASAVASEGANVLEIVHRRAFADISVGDVDLVMHLETRGREHAHAIIRALEAHGLAVEEEL